MADITVNNKLKRKLIPEIVTYTNDLIYTCYISCGLRFLWFIIKLYIFLDRSLIFQPLTKMWLLLPNYKCMSKNKKKARSVASATLFSHAW